ncbi:hypothetical protein JTE90_012005 [Oedothorax gibbosus]|uniref:Uncharacterized protein n=1 Tax=Oedothorax gibbosus TaxID=931172 RepID=A0AAV6US95_9ARAC|nr:hypothetical protein JTE90_012005 [Oedothorax gibbosus]
MAIVVKSLVVLFAICFLWISVAAEESLSDDEKFAKFQKHLCEDRNRTFNEDMNSCFLTEPQAVIDASKDCVDRATPGLNGNLVDFLETACHDKEAYLKFDACNKEYEGKEEYRSQMEVDQNTVDCYNKMLTKYNLPPLS